MDGLGPGKSKEPVYQLRMEGKTLLSVATTIGMTEPCSHGALVTESPFHSGSSGDPAYLVLNTR